MTDEEILSRVDHTLLKADADWEAVKALCGEAAAYRTASACIPPSYIKRAHDRFGGGLVIGTVIGFPLGYSTARVKISEAEEALIAGASEIDMVINLGDVKNRNFAAVEREITLLKEAVGKRVLKVIVEACYLTLEEKGLLCEIVSAGGADYIKTSTGFGPAGAALEDVRLFKSRLGPGVKIKGSGGIKTRDALEAFINAGCDRIGTSSAIALLAPQP
ncbi:MAG: deoxyribose-phosphate aldolase [Spirochaetaceae bacterium]|jgi:deoxyribose-phosphate aldolase|nr:deoxyribose-phosphate aldolase [Spirochaetaceae bacterium]